MLRASSARNPTAINPGVDQRDKLATHVTVLIWTPTLISLSMLVQWMETCTNTIRTLSLSLVTCMYVSEGTLYSVFLVKIVSNPTTPFHRRYSHVSEGTCKVPGHLSGIYAVKVLFPLNKYGFHKKQNKNKEQKF